MRVSKASPSFSLQPTNFPIQRIKPKPNFQRIKPKCPSGPLRQWAIHTHTCKFLQIFAHLHLQITTANSLSWCNCFQICKRIWQERVVTVCHKKFLSIAIATIILINISIIIIISSSSSISIATINLITAVVSIRWNKLLDALGKRGQRMKPT